MILGSDSHTRYGALGTMGVGEGGPELVKQLLGKTYDVARAQGRGRMAGQERPRPAWGRRTWPWRSSARCSGTAL